VAQLNGGEAVPLLLQKVAGEGGVRRDSDGGEGVRRSKGGEGPHLTTKGGGHDLYRKERAMDFRH
jgi:hypothetical protein